MLSESTYLKRFATDLLKFPKFNLPKYLNLGLLGGNLLDKVARKAINQNRAVCAVFQQFR